MIAYALQEIHGGRTHDGTAGPDVPVETWIAFGRSVLIIVAADGEVSDSEMREFISMMTGFGMPPQALETFKNFDPRGQRLEDHLPLEHRSMARHFIYDAIKVARVNGYLDAERKAVRKAAALAGVSESVVTAIEGLIEIEASLRSARLSLLREEADKAP